MWTVIVAGGAGVRFGRPKQFELLGGRLVVEHSVEAARSAGDGVVLVVPSGWTKRLDGVDIQVVGGSSRSASVRAGLAAVPADAAIVVVQDGARPLSGVPLFMAVIEAVRRGADGAIPVVALSDSIRRRDGSAVDRSEIVAVQTPQAFSAAALRRAHGANDEATDDATLVLACGGRVDFVDGASSNLKITHSHDLVVAEALLEEARSIVIAPPSQPLEIGQPLEIQPLEIQPLEIGQPLEIQPLEIRIGQGFDVHQFAKDSVRPLILGGVEIPGGPGLIGHSDADAVAHAVTDAILGAAGLGDIGQLYPDTNPAFAGVHSMALLADTMQRAQAAGWRVSNVDCTVVTEAPPLAPHRAAMQESVAAVVGAPVTIKGKRAEQLGALGRREGLACLAVVLLLRTSPA